VKKQSNEEKYVKLWLDECIKAGYVISYEEQPAFILFNEVLTNATITLKTKKITKSIPLLQERVYTADFKILFTSKAKGVFFIDIDDINTKSDFNYLLRSEDGVTYFEVKASNYNDVANTERFFLSRTQPIMYEKFNIYVNLVKPLLLFENTFVPKPLMHELYYKKDVYTGKGDKKKLKARVGDKKHKFVYRTLEEYINSKASN